MTAPEDIWTSLSDMHAMDDFQYWGYMIRNIFLFWRIYWIFSKDIQSSTRSKLIIQPPYDCKDCAVWGQKQEYFGIYNMNRTSWICCVSVFTFLSLAIWLCLGFREDINGKRNVIFRVLPKSPTPSPLTPIRATWSFFSDVKIQYLKVTWCIPLYIWAQFHSWRWCLMWKWIRVGREWKEFSRIWRFG